MEKKITNNLLFSPTANTFFSNTQYRSERDFEQLKGGFLEHFKLVKGKESTWANKPFALYISLLLVQR